MSNEYIFEPNMNAVNSGRIVLKSFLCIFEANVSSSNSRDILNGVVHPYIIKSFRANKDVSDSIDKIKLKALYKITLFVANKKVADSVVPVGYDEVITTLRWSLSVPSFVFTFPFAKK